MHVSDRANILCTGSYTNTHTTPGLAHGKWFVVLMTLYRVSGLVFVDCELCDGGDGVIVTVLAQSLVLEVNL